MNIIIKNGRVIDPHRNIDAPCDVMVHDGVISEVAASINKPADETIDAQGNIVMPGIVDMHVHLREPGREDKETVYTGTLAALQGGVTTLLAMPNTNPVIDSAERVKQLQGIIARDAQAQVLIAGAITEGRLGKKLAPIKQLTKNGVVAITDDGSSVDNDDLFRQALQEAKQNNIIVVCHSEDGALSRDGVINLGFMSTTLGLRGISRESEYKRVERDIALAHNVGARIHIAHVSCKESVAIIAKAKKSGVEVSAETAPHYFSLDETSLSTYDTNKKMNPPLRTADDVAAIREGLRNGTIDVIASDHAPHTDNEKDIEFDRASFGTIGLETELAAGIAYLVDSGVLTWTQLVKALTINPARLLGVKAGTLEPGSIADIVVVDQAKTWAVDRSRFRSKSKNSCFIGTQLKGRVVVTLHAGKVVYRDQS